MGSVTGSAKYWRRWRACAPKATSPAAGSRCEDLPRPRPIDRVPAGIYFAFCSVSNPRNEGYLSGKEEDRIQRRTFRPHSKQKPCNPHSAKGNAKCQGFDVAAEVKKQFGHTVGVNQIYMIKTKSNMKRRPKAERKAAAATGQGKLTSAVMWVDAIKLAKQLLTATGSVSDAYALLKAVDG